MLPVDEHQVVSEQSTLGFGPEHSDKTAGIQTLVHVESMSQLVHSLHTQEHTPRLLTYWLLFFLFFHKSFSCVSYEVCIMQIHPITWERVFSCICIFNKMIGGNRLSDQWTWPDSVWVVLPWCSSPHQSPLSSDRPCHRRFPPHSGSSLSCGRSRWARRGPSAWRSPPCFYHYWSWKQYDNMKSCWLHVKNIFQIALIQAEVLKYI